MVKVSRSRMIPEDRRPEARLEAWQVLEDEYVAQHGRLEGDHFADYLRQRRDWLARHPVHEELLPASVIARATAWLWPEATAQKGERRDSRDPRAPGGQPAPPHGRDPQSSGDGPVRAFQRALHQRATHGCRRSALCLSGGGIRSASFNLGVLQTLGQWRLLDQFDYISTVSGGGYIGSWLTAWGYNHPQGLRGVVDELAGRQTPETVQKLRGFSRFLSPRFGVLSVDVWTLVATYLRNLLLNWVVFIPLLLAALLAPRLVLALTEEVSAWPSGTWRGFSVRDAGSQLFFLIGAAGIAWAFAYAALSQPSTFVFLRETGNNPIPVSESGALRRFTLFCLVPLCVGAAFLCLHNRLPRDTAPLRVVLVGSGLVAIAALVMSKGLSHAAGAQPLLARWAAILGPLAFMVAGFIIGWWQRMPHWSRPLIFGVVVGALGGLLACLYVPRASNLRKTGWSVVAGLLAGALLLLGQEAVPAIAKALAPSDEHATVYYTLLAFPSALLALAAGGAFYVGLVSRSDDVWDGDREWWGRFGAWVLIVSIVWLVVGSLVLLGPVGLLEAKSRLSTISLASIGALSGAITLILGGGSGTQATEDSGQRTWPQLAQRLLLKAAAPVFLVFILASLSLLCAWAIWRLLLLWKEPLPSAFDTEAVWAVTTGAPWYIIAGGMVVLTTVSLVAASRIDLNHFSLHALYRDRLVRAFLGVSNIDRNPDAFTNLDGRDDIYLAKMAPGMFRTRDLNVGNARPFVGRLRSAAAMLRARAQAATVGNRPSALTTPNDPLDLQLVARISDRVRSELLACPNPPAWILRDLVDEVNRLIRSYDLTRGLGQVPEDQAEREERSARLGVLAVRRNAVWVERAFRRCFSPAHRARSKRLRPLHILNAALNLVSSNKPSVQDRKAGPFTFSALHCGSWTYGYRDSARYGGPRGIRLGTAMTISGAAVSPNQGYHSSPVITFLLALFNVRLGLWLGNPGPAGHDTWRDHAPRVGFTPPIMEAFGLTDDEHKYVYLSDGGHFDNLGVYEMIQRRCHDILVIDAGADPAFNLTDLGNAIRKIGIDSGVPINLVSKPLKVRARGQRSVPKEPVPYAALFEINYRAVDGDDAVRGRLLYIKPCLYWSEPPEVMNYAATSDRFPHESTASQFYNEAQMDSYRRLAMHELDWLRGDQGAPCDLEQLFTVAAIRVLDGATGAASQLASVPDSVY